MITIKARKVGAARVRKNIGAKLATPSHLVQLAASVNQKFGHLRDSAQIFSLLKDKSTYQLQGKARQRNANASRSLFSSRSEWRKHKGNLRAKTIAAHPIPALLSSQEMRAV